MSQVPPVGRRFSHVYLAEDSLSNDSQRMRRRLGSCFKEYFTHEHGRDTWLGQILEAELGISVVSYAHGSYVNWVKFFEGAEIRDVLDALTITFNAAEGKIGARNRNALWMRVSRIADEEKVGYGFDEEGGVHPRYDGAFDAVRSTMIAGLSSDKYSAALEHIRAVDSALLQMPMDGRGAIRAVFDVVENIFKQGYPSKTHLNTAAISTCLRPLVDARYEAEQFEKRVAQKMVDGLKNWVDTAHFYRHEAGQPEPSQPSQETAINMVSQGYTFGRWLIQILDDAEGT